MMQHLPALQVVIPLMAAPVAALLRWRRAAWAWALATSWAVLAMAILLLRRVMAEGTLSYALGGWAAPIGIEYRIDAVSAWVLVIVASNGAVVLTMLGMFLFFIGLVADPISILNRRKQ